MAESSDPVARAQGVRRMPKQVLGAARFFSLLAPQLVLSSLFLVAFSRLFFLPADFAALHLPLVAAVSSVFFLTLGFLIRRFPESRHVARLLAGAFWIESLLINAVYAGSAGTQWLSGDNLTWANLRTAPTHLHGLQLAFGHKVTAAVFVVLVAVLIYGVLLQRHAARLHRALQWGMSSDLDQAARRASIAVAAATCAVAAGVWSLQLFPGEQLGRDPLFSFWFGGTQRFSTRGNPLTEARARRDYPTNATFDRKNVFVFVVDCLRADHLPLYGYERDTTPFLRELQRSGHMTVVEHALSVGNESPQGIFGILASHYPEDVRPSSFTLYEALHRQGYRTIGILAGDHTAYAHLRELYGREFDVFIDGAASRQASVNDDAMVIAELNALPPATGTPVFMAFHLMSAHVLGVKKPAFNVWNPSQFDPALSATLRPDIARNTYDNRVRQADDYLRQIWTILSQKGYTDRYVAVITADHGEELGERGEYGHGRLLFEADTRIPILFLDSSNSPFPDVPFASQVDIAPTIVARIGLPIPSNWSGISLLTPPGRTTAFLVSRYDRQWRGIVRHEGNIFYKYLCYGPFDGQWYERFFDLHSDPGEQHDLGTAVPPNLLDEARQAVAHHFRIKIPPDGVGSH